MNTNTIPSQRFPRISTIDMVHAPVERFRERLDDAAAAGAGGLSPLDAYLLHLVLEFSPRPAFVADLACDATSGATSVVCLANAGVSRVAVASSGAPRRPGGAGLAEILREFCSEGDPARGRAVLPIGAAPAAWDGLRDAPSPHEMPLFLLDAGDAEGRRPGAILDEFPGGLVLVVGVGRPGDCEAVRLLVEECREGAPCRLRMMSDVAGPLATSRLAMVARGDHPFASQLLRRVGQAFATNHDFLDLVRDSCMYAVERGMARDLSKEIDGLRAELDGSAHRLGQEAHLRDLRDLEVARLGEEVARLDRDSRDLRGQADEEVRRLRLQLDHECNRPLWRSLVLQSGRRLLRFGRRNRALLAPGGGRRERTVKAVMRLQRRLRGKAA